MCCIGRPPFRAGYREATAPREDRWAPAVLLRAVLLCEDPDGIRTVANFLPGKGYLADAGKA
jgi:hypothetical protein